MPASVIHLSDTIGHPLGQVGGKASALGRLISYGAPVPPGFVVPPGMNLEDAAPQILAAHAALGAGYVAVRSSAAGEDSPDRSWAGQFESYLYVRRSDLLKRIADCRRSGTSARAQAYDQARHAMPVAVIVQAMVAAQAAGVLFTVNPVTADHEQVMVEAVYGLGEQLVSGIATPDNYLLSKASASILSESIATKTAMLVGGPKGMHERPVAPSKQDAPALTKNQLIALCKLATKLESQFGHPLDIEWAFADDALYILQARPITTLPGGTQ